MFTQPPEPGGFHMLLVVEWKAMPPSKNCAYGIDTL
ncbi:hypothetical protein JOF58_004920 [Streptomyces cinnamonensis]|nr:hypothetical protein [Streptomyces virginiae]